MIAEIGELLELYDQGGSTRVGLLKALLELSDRFPIAEVIAETPEPVRSELVAWARETFDNDNPLESFVVIGGNRALALRSIASFRNWARGRTEPVTWDRGKDLGTWSYTIERRDGEDQATALERSALEVLASLEGFARAAGLRAVTEERGDDGIVVDGPIDADVLRETFARGQHVIQLELALDLQVAVGEPPTEQVVPGAARLWLEAGDELELLLSIDVDLYAPVHGSTLLPSLNGPRLEKLLAALNRKLGAYVAYVKGFARLM